MIENNERYRVECAEAIAFLRSLPDACADALICDPPYSSGGMFRGDRVKSTTEKYIPNKTKEKKTSFTGDNRDQRSFFAWSTLWLSEALRVCKEGAPCVVFTDWRQLPTMTDAIQAGGWVWRGVVPWDKTEGARPTKGRFMAQAEFALWGSNGSMPLERGVGYLPGAYRVAIPTSERFHQTPKPVELLRKIVRICEPGGLIVDPFMGTGSCGVAAVSEGYRYLGCDMEQEFVTTAKERIRGAL